MLSILQSIHPKYCELIASGKKTIEVRKTKPRIPTPFKVYIYQTRHKWVYNIFTRFLLPQGKVIGEYVCNEIEELLYDALYITYYSRKATFPQSVNDEFLKGTCVSYEEAMQYCKNMKFGDIENNIKGGSFWGYHISNLKIYDKPKELSEFSVIDKEFLKECPYRERVYNNPDYTNGALLKGSYICNNSFEPDFCRGQCADAIKPLTRAPQSWCYVETQYQ